MSTPTLPRALFTTTLLLTPLAWAGAQNTVWLDSLAGQLLGLITLAVPLGVSLALLVFLWGLVLFILHSGDEKAVAEGKQRMVWGLVALFVIVSVWGLVALLQQLTGVSRATVNEPTFSVGGASGGVQAPPTNSPSQPGNPTIPSEPGAPDFTPPTLPSNGPTTRPNNRPPAIQ